MADLVAKVISAAALHASTDSRLSLTHAVAVGLMFFHIRSVQILSPVGKTYEDGVVLTTRVSVACIMDRAESVPVANSTC